MTKNNSNNIVIDFIKEKQSLGLGWSTFGLTFILFLVVLVFYFHIELYFLAICIGLLYSYLVITSPKIWLYSVAIFSGLFFHTSSEGVSILDVLFGALYLGGIFLWFNWQIFILKTKVVRNLGDWLILAFFFFLLFNLLIAYLNDVNLFLWMKEYLMFSIVLIYFPIRSVIKTEKELFKFLSFYSLIIIATGLFQIYLYYIRLTVDFVYAYEMKHGININQTLYTAASIFGFLFTFHQTNKKNELLVLLFTGMAVISLIATFSRTFWVVLAGAIFIFFVIFSIQKKMKVLLYSLIIVGLFIGFGYLFVPEKMSLLVNVIGLRFSSSTDGSKDLSVIARLMEWEQVIKKIFENPFAGNGLAKSFHFYNVIEKKTSYTDIIHNGFLYITYRTGIPTAILYFSSIIYYTIKSWDNVTKSKTNYLRALSYSNFAVIIALFIVNFTSPQYFYRDGIFVTAFVIAFICLNEQFIKISNKNQISNYV